MSDGHKTKLSEVGKLMKKMDEVKKSRKLN